MMGLREKERSLTAYWIIGKTGKLPNDLIGISLEVYALRSDAGFIMLSYEFSNFPQVLKALKEGEADSL